MGVISRRWGASTLSAGRGSVAALQRAGRAALLSPAAPKARLCSFARPAGGQRGRRTARRRTEAEDPPSMVQTSDLEAKFAQLKSGSGDEGLEAGLRDILLGEHPNDAEAVKVKEQAVQRLSGLYVERKDAEALRRLLAELRPLFAQVPKAKTAKIVRGIVEAMAKLEVVREQVAWAAAEKRTFLRQRLESRLATLLLASREFMAALTLISRLLSEVKRLDDKLLLVDVHLVESRAHHALRNTPKAKAALTAARTAANAIYVPPALQAEIDGQAGTLHAEERDYQTAFSYFLEAFQALAALDDPRAPTALKHLLLTKVMMKDAGEVPSIVASKQAQRYAGPEVEAMKAVAQAAQARSLEALDAALKAHREQLADDPIVHAHLSELYGALLEGNLQRLIEPYSRVEIAHLASLIKLPQATVQGKLSQMILDEKFAGTLDQGAGCLEVFEEAPPDPVYPGALGTIGAMERVVDTLFQRSQKLMT